MLIAVDTTSVLEVNFCQVNRNKPGSFRVSNSSLFISKRSIFKGNTINLDIPIGTIDRLGTLYGSIGLDTSTGYLENCTFLVTGVTLSQSELRLSHTVFYKNMVQKIPDISSLYVGPGTINRIYTYKSLMRHGNNILKSNTTDFKKIAMKEHFIREINNINYNNLTAKETHFASSKFSVSKNSILFVHNPVNLFYSFYCSEGFIDSCSSLLQLKLITVLSQFFHNLVSTTAPVTDHPGIEPIYSTVETKD